MSERLKLVMGDKEARLNPYKRITRGTEVKVTVDGAELVAVVDKAEKYSYLNVGGVDYYVTAKLEEGGAYETATWVPTAPKAKAKAEPVEGEAAAEPKAKKKRAPAEAAAA